MGGIELHHFLRHVSLFKISHNRKLNPLTIWRFQAFSVTQILREISLKNLEVLKQPFFASLKALIFVNLVFRLQTMQDFMKIKMQSL